jgi:glycosyltransferase involved in cell wall biosynthesis
MNYETVLFSVIVPCYNSETFIERTLAALFPQISKHDDVELILVDNNSTDSTLTFLSQFASRHNLALGKPVVRVLKATEAQGVNVSRNAGAAQAKGQNLLFTDHDDAVCPGWLDAYRQAFATGGQIFAGPYQEQLADGTVISSVNGLEYHHWSLGYGLGSNCGITRAGFNRIGGLQPQWQGGGDDADFFWRAHFAGLEVEFVPQARIIHFLREGATASFQQYRGYGRSAVRLYVAYRGRGMPRSSTLRALAAWPIALVSLPFSCMKIGSRRRALARLGVRWGRLTESVKQRVWYL